MQEPKNTTIFRTQKQTNIYGPILPSIFFIKLMDTQRKMCKATDFFLPRLKWKQSKCCFHFLKSRKYKQAKWIKAQEYKQVFSYSVFPLKHYSQVGLTIMLEQSKCIMLNAYFQCMVVRAKENIYRD